MVMSSITKYMSDFRWLKGMRVYLHKTVAVVLNHVETILLVSVKCY